MKVSKLSLLAAVALIVLIVPVTSLAKQPAQAGTQSQPTHTTKAAATAAAPTPQEIADAKAKGLVWVNTSTHVYHKDGNFYGTTKHGKFMTEDEAKKAGYRAAKEGGSKKKTASTATQ